MLSFVYNLLSFSYTIKNTLLTKVVNRFIPFRMRPMNTSLYLTLKQRNYINRKKTLNVGGITSGKYCVRVHD